MFFILNKIFLHIWSENIIFKKLLGLSVTVEPYFCARAPNVIKDLASDGVVPGL